jgi:hypothetical protein
MNSKPKCNKWNRLNDLCWYVLASEILLGIIGILAWGVGFILQSAWARLEKDENLVEIIRASKVAYAKHLKVARGVWNWTLESNKCN